MFPSEKVAKAIAETLGLEYIGYSDIPIDEIVKNVNINNVKDGVMLYQDKALTYLFDSVRVKNTLSLLKRQSGINKEVDLFIISKQTYDEIYKRIRRDDLTTATEKTKQIIQAVRDEEKGRRVLEYVLDQAIYHTASDVHIEYTGDTGTIIRFRTAGTLETFAHIPADLHPLIINYLKTEINAQSSDRETRKDGRLQRGELDIRVNIMPAVPYSYPEGGTNERAVLRLLRKNNSLTFGLENLPLSKVEIDAVKFAIKSSYGMILTSGPTSSGKTTTLYALLSNIDALEKKIITIEDPVEFTNPYLWHQHQVSEKMTFNEIIKGVLREDPDVCLIGEVRDSETASMLVRLANTGHLTFSTIHANNSYEIIRRLMDLGIDETAIRDFGVMFMAQRLLRKPCPYCKIERETTEIERSLLGIQDKTVIDNTGCEYCEGAGHIKSRVMVMEIMPLFLGNTVDYVVGGRGYRNTFEYLKDEFGIKRLVEKAMDLNRQGIVSMKEILDKVK
jgi:type II secretory ATPase GspE/PulE/Tfp pilus assembly ATPase PilB-like protein